MPCFPPVPDSKSVNASCTREDPGSSDGLSETNWNTHAGSLTGCHPISRPPRLSGSHLSPPNIHTHLKIKKQKHTTAFVHRSLGNPSLLWNLLPQIRKPSILFSPSFLCAPCDWSTGYTHRGIEVSFAIHGQVQACLCPLDCHNPQSHWN